MTSAYEKVLSMVGEESEIRRSVDEVNRPMIRHWCEAMQDGNPLYTDESYAKTTKFKGIIAPPSMAQTFSMRPTWPPEPEMEDPLGKAVKILSDAGYHAIVATTTSYEFGAPMRPGDRIFVKVTLTEVSPEKKTRLGKGHFVTSAMHYTNQKNEVVCKQSFTVLVFMPGA